jgi:DNA-binding transcriptional ArsR family regulator
VPITEVRRANAVHDATVYSQVVARAGSSRQAISQHLDVLESAGLVSTGRNGRYKFHFIDTVPLRSIVER